jgi:transcriptional regulator with XRE-family HTH domain
MAFGKRIKLFRTLRSMKQRQVGELLGFNGAATEVRMAQYESEAREPKAALIEQMASIFKVSPKAISVPEIDTYDGLMHTFFALEDMYGLKIAEIDGELCLHLDRTLNPDMNLLDLFELWHKQSMRLANGMITKQDYDEWRYNYPVSQAALEQAARDKRRKDRATNNDE